ncbi:Serine carboxypeptidase-like, partial [Thalictrum thalictroides]
MAKSSISFICLHHLLLLLVVSATVVVSKSIVRSLPGFDGPLPFDLKTGYVSVGESNEVQLFYYFVKSENNPTKDPLILWITGGPGCSSLTALLFEFGPLHLKIAEYNGTLPTLKLNPNSWTKVANILFLDSPVGSGFSYSKSSQGSFTTDTKSAQQSYSFIRKWLTDHPEYLSNPLYIGGDSYSGMIVPIIVQRISDGIDVGNKPLINLKGYLLGNPTTDGELETNSKVQFAYGMGLLSDELFESTKKNCGGNYVNVNPSNVKCTEHLQAISQCTSGVNTAHILEPRCILVTPKPKKVNSSSILRSPPQTPGFECRSYGYMLSYYWANDDRVQKALYVRK